MRNILNFAVLIGLLLVALWFAFVQFYPSIYSWLGVPVTYSIFLEEVPITVTVADTKSEWQQGLSGVTELGDQEGKLFIFDREDRYGIWMKDMLIPLDILWINDANEVVHIEENVSPDTFPKTFTSTDPARFVLEVPAFFVESFKISLGQEMRLPGSLVPKDLQ